jgi:hypothetical protein
MSNYCQSIECDDCRSEEREEMASMNLETEDHARSLKHMPLDALQNLGKVSTARTPPPCQPFTGDTPFPLSPADFSDWADGTVEATPLGGIIEMDLIVEDKPQ